MMNNVTPDKCNRIKIDLQRFAEGDGVATQTPSATIADPGQSVQQPENQQTNLSTDEIVTKMFQDAMANEQQNTVQTQPSETVIQQPAQSSAEPQQQEQLILGKFKNTEEVFRGYQNLQADYTRKSQELADTKKMVETLQEQLQQLTTAQPSVQPVQQTQQPQQDELTTLDAESYLSQFYEKPQDAIAKVVESTVKKILAPLESKITPVIQEVDARKTQELWDGAVTNFSQQNPDMAEFLDGMKQYISENKLGTSSNPEKVLKDAYIYAKGLKYQPSHQLDPKALLSDQNFRNLILQDESIKNELLKAHMQQIKDNQPPTVINSQSAGQAMVTPPNKPKTLDEAHDIVSSMFGLLKR